MTTISKTLLIGILLGTTPPLIISCNITEKDSIPIQDKNGKNADKMTPTMISVFKDIVPIDSTNVVMYPLTLRTSEKDTESIKRYSSGSDTGPYWNIAFYDIKTEKSNLLVSDRIIIINSFQTLKNLMVYNATSEDYNADGRLDRKDPTYLFTSDQTGKNLKQITPSNMNIHSFRTINHSGTILIQAMTDSNHDKKFDENDEIVPMIFDAEKMDVAKAVFSSSFKAELNKTLNKLY
jgi:hypothetical protein